MLLQIAASRDVTEPQDHGQEEDEHVCVVCIDDDQVVMFLNCGHLVCPRSQPSICQINQCMDR